MDNCYLSVSNLETINDEIAAVDESYTKKVHNNQQQINYLHTLLETTVNNFHEAIKNLDKSVTNQ